MEKPTEKEAEVLFEAQGDFIEKGDTDIKCPRCGNQLIYEAETSWEMTRCVDQSCISVVAKGI